MINQFIYPEAFSLYFYLIDKMFHKTLAYDLEFTGLDRYFIILWAIDEAEEQLTQQNIADLLKVDKAAIVRIVDELEKKGFLERTENPQDKRSYFLKLTRKAQKFIPDIMGAIANLNAEAMAGFSAQEKKVFLDLLHKVYYNLCQEPESDFLLNFEDIIVKKTSPDQ